MGYGKRLDVGHLVLDGQTGKGQFEELREILNALCESVGCNEQADSVFIIKRAGKAAGEVLGSWGCSLKSLSGDSNIPGLDAVSRPFITINGLDRAKWFRSHPLGVISPFTKRMIAIALPDLQQQCYLAILFGSRINRLREPTARYLYSVARLSSTILGTATVTQRNAGVEILQEQLPSIARSVPVGEEAILAFLANTLIRRASLRHKGALSYVIVRQWKAALKDVQLAALEGLKIGPSKVAANQIAHEISFVVSSIFEGMNFDAIVPVPCGSSGTPTCMSVEIASALAQILGVPIMNCLSGEPGSGRSHPHKSKSLKPYRLEGEVSGHLLLVDDVLTSGKHLQLACDALRAAGASVSSVVWVGS
jgi:hypothetical protein